MIQQAEWIAGLKLSDDDRKALVGRINSAQRQFARLRQVPLANDVPPAFAFLPSTEPAPDGAGPNRRVVGAGRPEEAGLGATTSPSCRSPSWRRSSARGRCRRSS